MSEWKPIETADRDARDETDRAQRVLLRFGDEGVSVAYWDAYYADGGDGCTDGFGWIEPCSGAPLNMYYSTPPTHWQPLPAPPDTKSQPVEKEPEPSAWEIEYDNDTGPGDEGFWEWRTVSNGWKSFKCETEADAKFLQGLLTKSQPD